MVNYLDQTHLANSRGLTGCGASAVTTAGDDIRIALTERWHLPYDISGMSRSVEPKIVQRADLLHSTCRLPNKCFQAAAAHIFVRMFGARASPGHTWGVARGRRIQSKNLL